MRFDHEQIVPEISIGSDTNFITTTWHARRALEPILDLWNSSPNMPVMEKVTGIGGFFFRGKDPEILNAWYEEHLGVRQVGKEYEDGSWWQDEGPTVFGAEPEEAQRVDGIPYQWRINFRVHDLDAMVAQLRDAGIVVEVEETVYPNGRFAHLRDPEGNSIELWEAGGTDAIRPAP